MRAASAAESCLPGLRHIFLDLFDGKKNRKMHLQKVDKSITRPATRPATRFAWFA